MSDFITNDITDNVEENLDVISRSLRETSDRTQDLSDEAIEFLSNAAAEVVRLAEKMRQQVIDAAKGFALQSTREVKEHPIASLAAALTAVAALASVIATARRSKSVSK